MAKTLNPYASLRRTRRDILFCFPLPLDRALLTSAFIPTRPCLRSHIPSARSVVHLFLSLTNVYPPPHQSSCEQVTVA